MTLGSHTSSSSAKAAAKAPAKAAKAWHAPRRRAREVRVGKVVVGGTAPISVQSMTNADSTDSGATLHQIFAIARAGADIVRVSCPDEGSTKALRAVVAESPLPVVADIHFHWRRAVEAAEAGAACLRVNPGNIGGQARVREVIAAAKANGCSLRIGVNGGSLERDLLAAHGGAATPEAMAESAMRHVRLLEEENFQAFKISVKASSPALTVAAYRLLATMGDFPLHLGVTESGTMLDGSAKSCAALGALLLEGIGDTLRISLAEDPVEEVKVGRALLKGLGMRQDGVTIIACPSCSRQGFDVIAFTRELESRLAHIRAPLVVSALGCVVNGPGEAAQAHVGFTGGGAGAGMLYISGIRAGRVANEAALDRLVAEAEKHAAAWHEEHGVQEVGAASGAA